MVYTELEIAINSGGVRDVYGTQDAMEVLQITKMTLYKWILQGKVKVRRVKIGRRTMLTFPEKDLKELKAKLIKKEKRTLGKPIIKA